MPRSADETISRVPYSAAIKKDDRATFQVSRPTFVPPHCLNVQEDASSYAIRLYPSSTEKMKIPSTSIGELAFHLSVSEIRRLSLNRPSPSSCLQLITSTGTGALVHFSANLDCCFNLTIFWTDHQQHPLMLQGSLKQRGIIIIVAACLDRRLTALSVV